MNPRLARVLHQWLPPALIPKAWAGSIYESANFSPRRGRVPGAAPRDAKADLTSSTRRELVRRSRYLHKNSGFMRELVGNMAVYSTGDGIRAQAQSAERGNLSQDLRPITEFCNRAVAGRYPLVASSTRDVLPEDFGQLFSPGGLMDDFFQKRLAPLVDTSSRPWKYKPVAGQGARGPVWQEGPLQHRVGVQALGAGST